ncbi:MAG: hydrogenase expression/formation C-terminal domain-containing protein [Candidatus Methylacidiphilaceae bacterium]
MEKGKNPKRKVPVSALGDSFLGYAPRIEEVLLAVERALASQRLWERPHSIPLAGLDSDERELLLGILGEGTAVVDVSGDAGQTSMATMLSGVWFTEKNGGTDDVVYTIDVGVLPAFAFARIANLPALALPHSSPASESVAASALLQELEEKQRAWEREGTAGEINLQLHALLPRDFEMLTAFLGQAPVIVWIGGHCRWWLLATRWRDLWRIEVRAPAGKKEASLLEIGRYPSVLTLPSSAFAVGARRVRRLLQLYGE